MLPLGQEPRSNARFTTLGLSLAGYPATFDPDFLRRHYLGTLAEPLAQNAPSSSITQKPFTLSATAEAPAIHRQDFCRAQPTANPNQGPDQSDSKAGTAKPKLAQPAEQNSSCSSRREYLERARQLRTEVLEAYIQQTDDATMSVQVESARWSLSICHMRCGEFAAARDLMALVAQTRTDRLGKDAKKTIEAERQLRYLENLLIDPGKRKRSWSLAGDDSDMESYDSDSGDKPSSSRQSHLIASGDASDDDEIIRIPTHRLRATKMSARRLRAKRMP